MVVRSLNDGCNPILGTGLKYDDTDAEDDDDCDDDCDDDVDDGDDDDDDDFEKS